MLADGFHRPITVTSARRINAPARAVWTLVGDLAAIDLADGQVEAIKLTGAGAGAFRELRLPGGFTISERIEEYDADAMTYVYRIVDYGPLWFVNYLGRAQVAAAGPGQCIVSWTSSAQPLDGCEEQTRLGFQQNMTVLFGVLAQRFGAC